MLDTSDSSGPPGLPAGGWSGRERLLLGGLLLLLLGLVFLRFETRRPDSSRIVQDPDILLLHVAGLRADAVATSDLASDLGLPLDRLLVFEEAFSPSSDERRSLLSVLAGDLVLNLQSQLGEHSLPRALAASGWQTVLVTEGGSPAGVPSAFGATAQAQRREEAPDALARLLEEAAPGKPLLAVVHLGSSGRPLHTDTTDADVLRERYSELVAELRGTVARLVQVSSLRTRPTLVALVGASGLELGEHPEHPDRPWDSRLRVPLLLGLRGGGGMPWGVQEAMVQTIDLAPTLLDFTDVVTGDAGSAGEGVSLGPLVHGWARPPVHERLFVADRHYAAVRTRAWKLSVPVEAPWRPLPGASELYSLSEDPGEQADLVASRPLGPVGVELLESLSEKLRQPEPGAGR